MRHPAQPFGLSVTGRSWP